MSTPLTQNPNSLEPETLNPAAAAQDLPALFKSGGLELLRPGLAKEGGYLEVYPRGHRKPYLLEQLEVFLEQKVRGQRGTSESAHRTGKRQVHAGTGR